MEILYKQLNKLLKTHTQTELADFFSIRLSYLNDIIHKRRSIEPIAAKLGYKKIYVKIR